MGINPPLSRVKWQSAQLQRRRADICFCVSLLTMKAADSIKMRVQPDDNARLFH